ATMTSELGFEHGLDLVLVHARRRLAHRRDVPGRRRRSGSAQRDELAGVLLRTLCRDRRPRIGDRRMLRRLTTPPAQRHRLAAAEQAAIEVGIGAEATEQ